MSVVAGLQLGRSHPQDVLVGNVGVLLEDVLQADQLVGPNRGVGQLDVFT